MATFPYYDPIPKTGGRISRFPQATETLDIVCREQVAAWLLQLEQDPGNFGAVSTYYFETLARDIVTEPVQGAFIRAYTVARNLVELATERDDPEWDTAVTFWLAVFGEISGLNPANNLYVNPTFDPEFTSTDTPTDFVGHSWWTGANKGGNVTNANGELHFNDASDTGVRNFCIYDIEVNNTGLEVGATYRMAFDCEFITRSGNNTILTISGASGLTAFGGVTSIPVDMVTRTNYIDFTIDNALYTGQFRFGHGATTTSGGSVIMSNPRLIKIS